MAQKHQTTTLSTTAQKVITFPNTQASVRCYFQNNDATNAVWIGNSTVTTSGATVGLKIAAGATMELHFDGGDTVWAIAAAGTPSLTVLSMKN